jgi:hypothetical protein
MVGFCGQAQNAFFCVPWEEAALPFAGIEG